MMLHRRDFIRAGLASALGLSALDHLFSAAIASDSPPPLLILLELRGGNDSLSTLIPFEDAEYHKLRPTLRRTKRETLPLTSGLGLHPALRTLAEVFHQGQVALLQGLGYEHQSFSHFRSQDVWDTGSDGLQVLSDGWATRAIRNLPTQGRPLDAVTLDLTGPGPARGLLRRSIQIDNPNRFRADHELQQLPPADIANPSLTHIRTIQENVNETHGIMSLLPQMRTSDFAGETLQVKIRIIKRLLTQFPQLPYLKFTHDGYDTHAKQRSTHDALMRELDSGLADLVRFLKTTGRWRDTVILTYSEFGRCPIENVSAGTDHGSSSSHFALGGRVKGGTYGERPRLSTLVDSQLPFTVDFRSVFSTVIADHWKIDPAMVFTKKFPSLGFVRY